MLLELSVRNFHIYDTARTNMLTYEIPLLPVVIDFLKLYNIDEEVVTAVTAATDPIKKVLNRCCWLNISREFEIIFILHFNPVLYKPHAPTN